MRQIGLIILLFFTSLAYAQNVEFKASAPSVVAVGEQFKLEYTLNKEGDNLKVPTLEGFDLLMGPSVGQSFYSSNINGKMTQNVTFSYTYILEGTKKGTFQIPGATVIIDGKEYIFASKGQVLDGIIGYDSKLYLVTDSKIEKNYFGALFSKKTFWGGPSFSGIYGTDKNGVLLEGIQRGSDGYLHYFQPKVESINKPTWKEIDGKRYRLTKSYRTERYAGMYTTIILTNDTLKVDDKTYTIDNEGVVTEFTAKNQFVRDDFWNWYYYDKEGKLLTGRQTIDGVQLYFDKNGKQVKGSLVEIDGKTYYFDKDSGAMWTNTTLEKDGKTYIIDEIGVATEKVN